MDQSSCKPLRLACVHGSLARPALYRLNGRYYIRSYAKKATLSSWNSARRKQSARSRVYDCTHFDLFDLQKGMRFGNQSVINVGEISLLILC